MLGAFAVGKTSLVARYVQGFFSDQYKSTIGVRIDKKEVSLGHGRWVTLVLWDIAGEDEFASVPIGYLRGASGYLLVTDTTRPETVPMAGDLRNRVERHLGKVPYVLLMNKSDLAPGWALNEVAVRNLATDSIACVCTSAKTGQGVQQAFDVIAKGITR